MSSYLTHHRPPRDGEFGWQISHSWSEFTQARLDWLYGPGRSETPESKADIAAWRQLGRRAAA